MTRGGRVRPRNLAKLQKALVAERFEETPPVATSDRYGLIRGTIFKLKHKERRRSIAGAHRAAITVDQNNVLRSSVLFIQDVRTKSESTAVHVFRRLDMGPLCFGRDLA